MKKYSKIIDGELVIKQANEIIIKCNGFKIVEPEHEQILEKGWVLYGEDEEDIQKDLEEAKKNKINEILSYDSSDNINIFYYNNIPMWFDSLTRVRLKRRLDTEINNGKNITTLWYNNISFEIEIEKAMFLLNLIEDYAIKTYDTTQMNIQKINEMLTIEDLKSYNYKQNYPDILYL